PLSSTDKAPVLDTSKIKPASSKSKDPPPLVWASLADFKAGEACDAAVSMDRRQYLRDEARADYQKALKIDPKCVPAYQGLARLYSALHDTPLAIETYQNALKISPNNAALWYELGMCHHSRKDVGPALECLDRAAKLDPGNRSYVNGMGVVLAEAGRYDESLNCFSRSGGEALGYYRLARTLDRLQRPELSQRYLAVALEKDPSLASMLAPPNSAAAAVQQTAYQAPMVSTAPAAPVPPRVISLEASQSHESPRQVLLPPPPAVNVQYEQPNP
ncbi:MAG TPA: tetratricopeptide repeat protein, partial [Gemmataceae bacterium]|nr:tetratricopeptide repeat protein [Gemmataceae bacterium]